MENCTSALILNTALEQLLLSANSRRRATILGNVLIAELWHFSTRCHASMMTHSMSPLPSFLVQGTIPTMAKIELDLN